MKEKYDNGEFLFEQSDFKNSGTNKLTTHKLKQNYAWTSQIQNHHFQSLIIKIKPSFVSNFVKILYFLFALIIFIVI